MPAPTRLFDRPNPQSKFLSFVAREFNMGRGTPLRSSLADKTQSATLVRELGIRVPQRLADLDDIHGFADLKLPDRFALKYAHGWSARGVMLLQRLGTGQLYCLLSDKTLSNKEIVKAQQATAASFPNKKSRWIVEELVRSPIPGKPIPLDYKFYCFGSQIGLVVQIDRNTSPVKVCLLAPDFRPLRHGTDYILTSLKAQLGTPLVPLHAARLAAAARLLSSVTDSPFVSIDMYDSPEGPVFGEFTFSPGGTHKRMWHFEDSVITSLDGLFEEAEAEVARRGGGPGPKVPLGPARPGKVDPEVYGILAGAVLNGSARAAMRLADLFGAGAAEEAPYAESWAAVARLLENRTKDALASRVASLKRHQAGLGAGQPSLQPKG